MKTMRQHLNRLERKLSKYPEEKRRFTSGKGSRRPVLELASDIVFEEFSEDINEVQKKYDVIIEWEAHSLFEERIPLMKVTISPEHPFFKEHLEKVGSGWHAIAPTNSVEKGTPIVHLYSKREDKQDRTALIASRFQVQYVGYLDMTLEDIITNLERWFNVPIGTDASVDRTIRLSFHVRHESLEETLQVISLITGLQYTLDGESATFHTARTTRSR